MLLVMMNIIDWLYTDAHLNGYGGSEANPFMNYVWTYHGMAGIAIFKGAMLAILALLVPYIHVSRLRCLFYLVVLVYVILTGYHVFLWNVNGGYDGYVAALQRYVS